MTQPGGPPTGLTHRAIGGMFWTLSGTGVQAVVQLLTIMALGRLLTPAEFGLMGAAAVIIAFSQVVSQIGVGPAIIQRRELEVAHVQVAATLSWMLGLALGAVIWLGAAPLASFYHMAELEPVLRILAFLFPLDGLNTVAKSLLTRELRFRLLIALEAGSYIIGYAGVAVVLAWLGYGVWALVFGQLAQVGLRTVAMYWAVRHPVRPSLDRRAGLDLLSFGFGHSLAQIGAVASQQADNLVVGRWLGAEALGIYGRAYMLMVTPATVFGRIVNRVLFPVMSQVQGERARLANAYERSLAVVAFASLPVSAVLWVLAPELVPVLLGPAWGAVVAPFRLFSISLLFRMSSRISDACTKAAGEVYWRAVIQWVFAGLVVGGAIIGQRWGVGGVAVAVSIAMGINWLSMAQLGRRVTGLDWGRFARAHGAPACMAVVAAVGALLAVEAGRAVDLGALPILILGGAGAILACAMAVRLQPAPCLGEHGAWVMREAGALMRRRSRRTAPPPGGESETLLTADRSGLTG